MIANFENDGRLDPVMFFLKAGKPIIIRIPDFMFSSQKNKTIVSNSIKLFTHQPDVLAAGIIIEAWGAKLSDKDELVESLKKGEKQVRDLEEKQDVIIMLFSTPEKEEMIGYTVDCVNKKVCEKFSDGEDASYGGIFANFFTWNRN
ncbi:MAG: hypothetical protein WC333_00235 [Dehalococcoidia bacterium]